MMQAAISSAFTEVIGNWIVKFFLGPITTLIDCYITINKHNNRIENRDIIIIALTLAGVSIGIIAFTVSPTYHNAFEITPSPIINGYFSAWLFSYPPAVITNFGLKKWYKRVKGDERYYLDEERLAMLNTHCHILAHEILAVFLFLLKKFRSGTITVHANAGTLEEVLDAFMYGDPNTVTEKYYQHRDYYDAVLLMQNNLLLLDTPKMNTIAHNYGVDLETIQAVLRFSVDDINDDMTPARREERIDIISKILSGSATGHMAFLAQQHLAIQRRQDIESLQRNNAIELQNLQQLITERKSPQQNKFIHEGSDDAVFEDALPDEEEQIDREALALQVFRREKSSECESNGLNIIDRKLTDEELEELITHLFKQAAGFVKTLSKISPAIEVCIPSTDSPGDMECFSIQRSEAKPSPTMVWSTQATREAPSAPSLVQDLPAPRRKTETLQLA